jgi:hypothetical protein
MVAACTEDERYWEEDFPNSGSFPPGYYADNDYDGLPNWFEMYWSGKLGDFTAATGMKPGDNPAGDGSTNLQKYLSRNNPLVADKPLATGANWNLLKNPRGGSFNPETDSENHPAWRYLSGDGAGQWTAYTSMRYTEKAQGGDAAVTHSQDTQNRLNPPPPLDRTSIAYLWEKSDGQGDGWKRRVVLSPLPTKPVEIEWTCPGDGAYHVDLAADVTGHAAAQLKLVGTSPDAVWNTALKIDHPSDTASANVRLKRGETLCLQADSPQFNGGELEVTRFEITLTALP